MSKAYLFAMFLLAASFTGCLGGDEEDTIEPIGEEDDSGQPGVEFVGLFEDNILIFAAYDSDGYVRSYAIESSSDGSLTGGEGDCNWGGAPFTDSNSNSAYDCYPVYGSSIIIETCYAIEPVDQTITVKIEDNDGNKASAEYDLNYDDLNCDDYEDENIYDYPIATFFVQEDSSGVFHVDVIMVSKQEDLTDFSFYLKDENGATYVGGNGGFGEIALQNMSGVLHGIETHYDGYDNDLEARSTAIANDNGTDYPVHFSDNDRDGKLSAGDQFMVYGQGNGANGPASDGWRLDIQYDPSGDIVGSAKML